MPREQIQAKPAVTKASKSTHDILPTGEVHGNSDNLNSESESTQRSYLRAKLLHEHIQRVLRLTHGSSKTLPQRFALTAALHDLTTSGKEDARTPGGLSAEDMRKLPPVPPMELSARFCRHLESELQQTLLTLFDYFSPEDAEPDGDEGLRLQSALQLPDMIRQRRVTITQEEASLEECRARIIALIEQINQVDPTLHSTLARALSELPPQLHASRAAQADVIATTVEAALLKLSLVRAQAYRALYGFSPPGRPGATVARAIASAHEKLQAREEAQQAEMQRLDRQIEEYESVLSLIGGRDGSFAQVVEDMARVKKETEECRKDLRRLGWTGD